VGQFDPVDLRKDAVPVDAADVVAGDSGELAGAALVQLQATWRQWCRSHAPAGTALRADPLPGAGR
ncbi:hypothetical protein LZM39_29775, partial [Pseudomonas aeruginosa]|nr:hypothetical protein [Pseudomonas aeruginosa]